jgi:hypothetical protein
MECPYFSLHKISNSYYLIDKIVRNFNADFHIDKPVVMPSAGLMGGITRV